MELGVHDFDLLRHRIIHTQSAILSCCELTRSRSAAGEKLGLFGDHGGASEYHKSLTDLD